MAMTKLMQVTIICGLIVVGAAGVMASENNDETVRAKHIVEMWLGWVQKHKITQATIAISYNGEIIAENGIGNTSGIVMPVASLSKAITGICIAKLVESGKIDFEQKISELISGIKSDVKISSLLSHSSGYQKDITQQNVQNYPSLNNENLEWVSESEIAVGQKVNEGAEFYYNNANYALLGLVIKQQTGKKYEDACNDLVFEPIGIKGAKLNPEWRVMASWGGWSISAVNYLKFLDAYFDDNEVLGK